MITSCRFVLGCLALLIAFAVRPLVAASSSSYYVPSNKYPPTGRYLGRSGDTVKTDLGVYLRSIVLRDLSHVGAPPGLGANQTYSFNGTVDF